MSDIAAGAAPRRPRRSAPPRRTGIAWPWLDRAGRFSALKLAVLLLTLVPGAVMGWNLATDNLGPEPVVALTHGTGLWAIRLLLVTMLVTPLRHVADWPGVVALRRMLGLAALAYVVAHLLLYVVDQKFRVLHVLLEIVRRTYLTIRLRGAARAWWCWVSTSTDGWNQAAGPALEGLHRTVFVLTALGVLHFFLQSKIDVSEAVLTAGLFLWLLLWRLLPGRWRADPLALLGLAVATVLGAVLVEYAWYALATRLPAGRVLLGNLDLTFGPRPAVWAGIAALPLAVLPLLRRWLPGRARLG